MKSMSRFRFRAGMLAIAALAVSVPARAQLAEFRGVPGVQDFLTLLAPEGVGTASLAQRSDVTMREIRDEPALPGLPVAAPAPRPTRPVSPPSAPRPPSPAAIAMPDFFLLNSAELPPRTVAMLDNLATAMRQAPEARVLISGHTDASGPVSFNEALSQRRAEAARRHLSERHGVAVSRIEVIGVGPRQPIPGLEPLAPNHRRIQVWRQ
jgi:outer membrane protein OmpA-like peptidoglycan-associated protein